MLLARVVIVTVPLLFLACTAGEPTPAPKTEPAPAKADPQPVADEAKPAVPTEWWCVCYQIDGKGEDGPQPASSCRAQEQQCHALERRVTTGGRGIVPNSVTHTCRKLVGEHPGDTTGGRELWKPSKLEGAWTSDGACLLPGEPDHVPGDPAPADALGNEAIGKLRLGMSASEVAEVLPTAPTKSAIEEEGASGNFVQTWTYAPAGVRLSMAAATADGPQSVDSVRITAPCLFKTARGIGVGSTWAEVDKAYGDVHNEDEPSQGYVAGSIFGGVIFDFDNDTVSSIFLGAAAE